MEERREIRREIIALQTILHNKDLSGPKKASMERKIASLRQKLDTTEMKLDHEVIKSRRQFVEENKGLRDVFNAFWLALLKYTEEGVLLKSGFSKLVHGINICLAGHATYIPLNQEEVDHDWTHEKLLFGQFDKPAFFDFLFETIETWTGMVDPSYYAAFAWSFLDGIADTSFTPPRLRPHREMRAITRLDNEAFLLKNYLQHKKVRAAISLQTEAMERVPEVQKRLQGRKLATELDDNHTQMLEAMRRGLPANILNDSFDENDESNSESEASEIDSPNTPENNALSGRRSFISRPSQYRTRPTKSFLSYVSSRRESRMILNGALPTGSGPGGGFSGGGGGNNPEASAAALQGIQSMSISLSDNGSSGGPQLDAGSSIMMDPLLEVPTSPTTTSRGGDMLLIDLSGPDAQGRSAAGRQGMLISSQYIHTPFDQQQQNPRSFGSFVKSGMRIDVFEKDESKMAPTGSGNISSELMRRSRSHDKDAQGFPQEHVLHINRGASGPPSTTQQQQSGKRDSLSTGLMGRPVPGVGTGLAALAVTAGPVPSRSKGPLIIPASASVKGQLRLEGGVSNSSSPTVTITAAVPGKSAVGEEARAAGGGRTRGKSRKVGTLSGIDKSMSSSTDLDVVAAMQQGAGDGGMWLAQLSSAGSGAGTRGEQNGSRGPSRIGTAGSGEFGFMAFDGVTPPGSPMYLLPPPDVPSPFKDRSAPGLKPAGRSFQKTGAGPAADVEVGKGGGGGNGSSGKSDGRRVSTLQSGFFGIGVQPDSDPGKGRRGQGIRQQKPPQPNHSHKQHQQQPQKQRNGVPVHGYGSPARGSGKTGRSVIRQSGLNAIGGSSVEGAGSGSIDLGSPMRSIADFGFVQGPTGGGVAETEGRGIGCAAAETGAAAEAEAGTEAETIAGEAGMQRLPSLRNTASKDSEGGTAFQQFIERQRSMSTGISNPASARGSALTSAPMSERNEKAGADAGARAGGISSTGAGTEAGGVESSRGEKVNEQNNDQVDGAKSQEEEALVEQPQEQAKDAETSGAVAALTAVAVVASEVRTKTPLANPISDEISPRPIHHPPPSADPKLSTGGKLLSKHPVNKDGYTHFFLHSSEEEVDQPQHLRAEDARFHALVQKPFIPPRGSSAGDSEAGEDGGAGEAPNFDDSMYFSEAGDQISVPSSAGTGLGAGTAGSANRAPRRNGQHASTPGSKVAPTFAPQVTVSRSPSMDAVAATTRTSALIPSAPHSSGGSRAAGVAAGVTASGGGEDDAGTVATEVSATTAAVRAAASAVGVTLGHHCTGGRRAPSPPGMMPKLNRQSSYMRFLESQRQHLLQEQGHVDGADQPLQVDTGDLSSVPQQPQHGVVGGNGGGVNANLAASAPQFEHSRYSALVKNSFALRGVPPHNPPWGHERASRGVKWPARSNSPPKRHALNLSKSTGDIAAGGKLKRSDHPEGSSAKIVKKFGLGVQVKQLEPMTIHQARKVASELQRQKQHLLDQTAASSTVGKNGAEYLPAGAVASMAMTALTQVQAQGQRQQQGRASQPQSSTRGFGSPNESLPSSPSPHAPSLPAHAPRVFAYDDNIVPDQTGGMGARDGDGDGDGDGGAAVPVGRDGGGSHSQTLGELSQGGAQVPLMGGTLQLDDAVPSTEAVARSFALLDGSGIRVGGAGGAGGGDDCGDCGASVHSIHSAFSAYSQLSQSSLPNLLIKPVSRSAARANSRAGRAGAHSPTGAPLGASAGTESLHGVQAGGSLHQESLSMPSISGQLPHAVPPAPTAAVGAGTAGVGTGASNSKGIYVDGGKLKGHIFKVKDTVFEILHKADACKRPTLSHEMKVLLQPGNSPVGTVRNPFMVIKGSCADPFYTTFARPLSTGVGTGTSFERGKGGATSAVGGMGSTAEQSQLQEGSSLGGGGGAGGGNATTTSVKQGEAAFEDSTVTGGGTRSGTQPRDGATSGGGGGGGGSTIGDLTNDGESVFSASVSAGGGKGGGGHEAGHDDASYDSNYTGFQWADDLYSVGSSQMSVGAQSTQSLDRGSLGYRRAHTGSTGAQNARSNGGGNPQMQSVGVPWLPRGTLRPLDHDRSDYIAGWREKIEMLRLFPHHSGSHSAMIRSQAANKYAFERYVEQQKITSTAHL